MLQREKQARAREPEEKENQCVLGRKMTAWEKVKVCCSVGLREKSGWGEGEGGDEEEKERREQRGMYKGGEVALQVFWE